MAEQIEASIGALREDIARVSADVGKLADAIQTLVRHGGSEALGKMRESAERLKEEAKRSGRSLMEEVEERPAAAAVIAFLAGAVLAALFSRRA